ncbi:MAG: TrbI/VirB10 family protein [Janthinobacterium lividum]
MTEETPITVPAQPIATSPINKKFPFVVILIAIVILIALANITNLVSSKGKTASKSNLPNQPATISPQQVKSYQSLQANEARRDAEERQQRVDQQANQQAAAGYAVEVPGPEADTAAPMTAAQKQAIYGDNPNAPKKTSTASQAHAEAAQRSLARAKLHQDALNSGTVAIDFSTPSATAPGVSGTATQANNAAQVASTDQEPNETAEPPARGNSVSLKQVAEQRAKPADPMGGYDFDNYQGRVYRVFEGTVLEGVVTNHIDGAFNGPILIMLTTDYYSHDHQQLLMPQGTRLIGSVQSVGSQGQRRLFVTFHRAVCPDGFSLDFDKYIALDPIGTTGLSGKVDNHYLSSFAAAAAVGGIGGLAQIGNGGSVLNSSAQIRNGISQQSAQESEQILNHFLNRLPTITLKEGSRARVYIGRDILIPSYAEHRVDPTL